MKTVFVDEEADAEQLYKQAQQRLDELEELVYKPERDTESFSIDPEALSSNVSPTKYQDMVEKAK